MTIGINKKVVLFFPGGPGLNAERERQVLTSLFHRVGIQFETWDEPRALNDSPSPIDDWTRGATERLMTLAKDGASVVVVGHSFSCLLSLSLAKTYSDRIRAWVGISPGLDLFSVQKRVLQLAIRDFSEAQRSTDADALNSCLSRAHSCFDDAVHEGFQLALTDPKLFDNYWKNSEAKSAYFKVLATPGWGLDQNRFFHMLKDFGKHHRHYESLCFRGSAILIVGSHDPLSALEEERALAVHQCPNFRVASFGASSYYPHLEEAEAFVAELTNLF